MANISVPIGKGTGKTLTELKFPDIPRAQPEFVKEIDKPISDLAFYKLKSDEGKIRSGNGGANGNNTITMVTVPTGSTFYLLECTYSAASNGLIDLILDDGTFLKRASVPSAGTPSGVFDVKGLTVVATDADIIIQADSNNDPGIWRMNLTGYLENTPVTSSRGINL